MIRAITSPKRGTVVWVGKAHNGRIEDEKHRCGIVLAQGGGAEWEVLVGTQKMLCYWYHAGARYAEGHKRVKGEFMLSVFQYV